MIRAFDVKKNKSICLVTMTLYIEKDKKLITK